VNKLSWGLVLLLGAAACTNQGPNQNLVIADGGGGACTTLPIPGTCTTTLSGDLKGISTCENSFTNLSKPVADLSLRPADSGIYFALSFAPTLANGLPTLGKQTVVDSKLPPISYTTMSGGHFFEYAVSDWMTIDFELLSGDKRIGGTPGDYCLHGHITAPLHRLGDGGVTNAATLTIDF
jgi:hypothetical protein